MRAGALLVLVGIGLLAAAGPAVAADNTAPLPDAGVDQTVTVNSTVYLDATGSVDPDGTLTSVAWEVETPAGGTLSPNCVDCRRTEFDATTVGQYTVTLTVTDDDGATRSDTLYVTVTNESGPSVSLSGPRKATPNTATTFTATVSKDRASLQSIAWLVNGSVAEREPLDGASANHSFTHTFDSTGEVPLKAIVYDTLGERGSARRGISVGGTSDFVSTGCFNQLCGNGSDKIYIEDGQTTIVDTNNKEGIQLWSGDDGTLVTYDLGASESVTRDDNAYRLNADTSLDQVTEQEDVTVVDDTGSKSSGIGGGSDSDGSSDPLPDTDDIIGDTGTGSNGLFDDVAEDTGADWLTDSDDEGGDGGSSDDGSGDDGGSPDNPLF